MHTRIGFMEKKSDPEAYDRAWLHHLHNNPHHWQYWVMPPEFNPDGDHDNGCLKMPEEYVLEMIADWMGQIWLTRAPGT